MKIQTDLQLKTFIDTTITNNTLLSETKKNVSTKKVLKYALSKYLLEKVRRKSVPLFVGIGHHKNTRGEHMTFSNNRFLWQLYQDTSHHLVFRKCVQVGVSELFIVKAIDRAREGGTVLYVLPTAGLSNTFVSERIDSMITNTPYYHGLIPHDGVNNKTLKQFGHGSIYFTGAGTRGGEESQFFSSVAATDLILDEYDRMCMIIGEDKLKTAYSRLESIEGGGNIIECANPRGVDVMIDARFKASSQNFWLVPCEHCGKWQYLDWFTGVVRQISDTMFELRDKTWTPSSRKDIQFICKHCERPMNRFHEQALWVPREPMNPIHGYSINKLMFAYTILSRMWKTFQESIGNPTQMRIFYGDYLGLGYQDDTSSIEESHVLACRDENYAMPEFSQTMTVAGIDVHKVYLHVTIFKIVGHKMVMLAARRVKDENSIKDLLIRYNVAVACFDSLPETRMVKRLKEDPQVRHVIFDVQFEKDFKINKTERKISVNHTAMLDDVFQHVLLRNFVFPHNVKNLESGTFMNEVTSSVRIDDIWMTKNNRDDHFLFSLGYALLAETVMRSIYTMTAINEMTSDHIPEDGSIDQLPVNVPLFGITTKEEMLSLIQQGILPEVDSLARFQYLRGIALSMLNNHHLPIGIRQALREFVIIQDKKFNTPESARKLIATAYI